MMQKKRNSNVGIGPINSFKLHTVVIGHRAPVQPLVVPSSISREPLTTHKKVRRAILGVDNFHFLQMPLRMRSEARRRATDIEKQELQEEERGGGGRGGGVIIRQDS